MPAVNISCDVIDQFLNYSLYQKYIAIISVVAIILLLLLLILLSKTDTINDDTAMSNGSYIISIILLVAVALLGFYSDRKSDLVEPNLLYAKSHKADSIRIPHDPLKRIPTTWKNIMDSVLGNNKVVPGDTVVPVSNDEYGPEKEEDIIKEIAEIAQNAQNTKNTEITEIDLK